MTGFTNKKNLESFDVLTLWDLISWFGFHPTLVWCFVLVVIIQDYFGPCTLAFHFAQELDNISNSSHQHRVIKVD